MRFLAISFIILINVIFTINAQNPKEIMSKVNLQNSPIDEQVDFKMTLVDANNRVRERTGTQFSKRVIPERWESCRLIKFHSPSEMAKSTVLILEKKDAENQQWIYLPATYSTRRIPSKNRGDRYMGTDFSYEDVSSIEIEKYQLEIKGTEKVDGRECFVIEQIPNDPTLLKESMYGKTVQYIEKQNNVIIKTEYYDKKLNLIKRLIANDFIKTNNYFRPQHIEMEDMKLKHKTIIDYKERLIGKGIDDEFFSIQSIERQR